MQEKNIISYPTFSTWFGQNSILPWRMDFGKWNGPSNVQESAFRDFASTTSYNRLNEEEEGMEKR